MLINCEHVSTYWVPWVVLNAEAHSEASKEDLDRSFRYSAVRAVVDGGSGPGLLLDWAGRQEGFLKKL